MGVASTGDVDVDESSGVVEASTICDSAALADTEATGEATGDSDSYCDSADCECVTSDDDGLVLAGSWVAEALDPELSLQV